MLLNGQDTIKEHVCLLFCLFLSFAYFFFKKIVDVSVSQCSNDRQIKPNTNRSRNVGVTSYKSSPLNSCEESHSGSEFKMSVELSKIHLTEVCFRF
jgi:hypothetical protein